VEEFCSGLKEGDCVDVNWIELDQSGKLHCFSGDVCIPEPWVTK
jgi:hypothetical protein